MAQTNRAFTVVAAALVLSLPIFGQGLVEHGAAAAGASAGAAAGKVVSDGLSSLGNLLGGAAKTGQPKQEPAKEAKPDKPLLKQKTGAHTSSNSSDTGATTIAVGSGIFTPQPHHVVHAEPRSQSSVPVPLLAPVTYAEPRQASGEDLDRVKPGMGRSEVLAMGAFFSRITIPQDNGRMLEVLQYDHATVRLEDGAVVSVSRN